MKTRYKILFVIAITLSVYGGLYIAVSSCNAISDCEILYDLYEYVGLSVVTPMCESSEMVNGVKCDLDSYDVRLNNDGYFFFFFVIIPSLIITVIWYVDKK